MERSVIDSTTYRKETYLLGTDNTIYALPY